QVDLPVQARTDAGNTLTMTLRAILPTEFTSTRTRPVRFDLTGDTATTAVGQAVTLDLPVSAPRDMLVVPKDALVQAGGGWRVFVNDDGKASPRSVTIGAAIGDSFAVLSGLAPGDEVVVRGNERLRPGQAISTGRGRPGGEGRPGGGRPDSGGSGRPAAEGTGGQPREQGQAARTAPARAAATTAQRTSTGG
ncbi:MAG: efflux RND transporter periplasmic adaptor subunit, partial [Paracoccaceae bacterium]